MAEVMFFVSGCGWHPEWAPGFHFSGNVILWERFLLFCCGCLKLFQETFGKLQEPKLKIGCSDFCREVYLLPKFVEEITSLTVGQGVWGCGDDPP